MPYRNTGKSGRKRKARTWKAWAAITESGMIQCLLSCPSRLRSHEVIRVTITEARK